MAKLTITVDIAGGNARSDELMEHRVLMALRDSGIIELEVHAGCFGVVTGIDVGPPAERCGSCSEPIPDDEERYCASCWEDVEDASKALEKAEQKVTDLEMELAESREINHELQMKVLGLEMSNEKMPKGSES